MGGHGATHDFVAEALCPVQHPVKLHSPHCVQHCSITEIVKQDSSWHLVAFGAMLNDLQERQMKVSVQVKLKKKEEANRQAREVAEHQAKEEAERRDKQETTESLRSKAEK